MNIDGMDSYAAKENDAEIFEYLRIIWRRKWLVILVVVPITAFVLIASLYFMTPQYQASTRLLQRQLGLDTAFLGTSVFRENTSQPDRSIDTSVELVKSPEVVSAVRNRLGDQHGGMQENQFLEHITIKAEQKIDIIEITATDSDPAFAADIANAFAEEYIKWREFIDKDILTQASAPIKQKIDSTPANDRDTPEYASLINKLDTLELVKSMQGGNTQIVNQAKPSTVPVSPKPMRNAALAFITSLFAGVSLAILMDKKLDTKIRNIEYVTMKSGKPILALVPKEVFSEDEIDLVTISRPLSSAAEAYRLLKTNLQFMNPGTRTKKILVTSPGPFEGKSTTIANLAITLAEGNQIVSILELDIRRPSLAKKLGLKNEPGLTDVIAGSRKLNQIEQIFSLDNPAVPTKRPKGRGKEVGRETTNKFIRCFLSGPVPPNPGDLIATEMTKSIIGEVAASSDYVLIDSPPLGVISDAATLSQTVDGIIIVVRLAQSDKKMLNRLLDTLSHLPSNVLGFVITDAEVVKSGYYNVH